VSDEKNPFPNEGNTGHIWDENLRELTNPPPKWWMYGLHASWIVVVLYTIIYPSWPLLTTHTKGIMGWTAINEYKEDMQEIEAIRGQYEEQLAALTANEILENDELKSYTIKSAKVLFGDNCAACHGSGGAGNPGYPVLADDDWLFGGNIDTIVQSISYGRQGNMPAHTGTLTDQEISDVAQHVVAMSKGEEHAAGKAIFTGKGACFACHGMDGKGNHLMGSANLTDPIWRFGDGSVESVVYTIAYGVNDPRYPNETLNAVMPAFGGTKLSDHDIKKLAVYVHQFGGGQ